MMAAVSLVVSFSSIQAISVQAIVDSVSARLDKINSYDADANTMRHL
jgi:outer membrane lipoprotein-sorting protein